MALSHTFSALGRLLGRRHAPPPDVLDAYAHEVVPVLDRAEWLFQYWLEQSMLFSDGEKLGNVAAIHRWEAATMGRSLERVIPPSALAGAHDAILDALDLASQAAQLLSSGSRYHNANALCEGQALLVTSRARRLDAIKALRRYLPASRPGEAPVQAGPGAGSASAVTGDATAAARPMSSLTTPVEVDAVPAPIRGSRSGAGAEPIGPVGAPADSDAAAAAAYVAELTREPAEPLDLPTGGIVTADGLPAVSGPLPEAMGPSGPLVPADRSGTAEADPITGPAPPLPDRPAPPSGSSASPLAGPTSPPPAPAGPTPSPAGPTSPPPPPADGTSAPGTGWGTLFGGPTVRSAPKEPPGR